MRSCVITGASTGIGEACARRLDAAGWRVFAGVRREQDAARLRDGASARLQPVMIDVTDAASIAAAAALVQSVAGEDDVSGLVNNAGIAVAAPLEYLPIDEFRRQLEVNVTGQLAVTQAFMPLLRRSRDPARRLVLMGSIGGRAATPFLGAYSASKFALEGMADALRIELQPWGIDVAIVEPGSIATPIWSKGDETAVRLAARFPRDAEQHYGSALAAMRQAAGAAGRRGIPPDVVAEAVEHALTSRRPRTRYLVGTDAKLRARIGSLLPDRLSDRLLTRLLKLPPRRSPRANRTRA
jgi:NAD(P)-dependent dehydrogenase (short-subunit alcohol dehydrogenase family)